MCVLWSLAIATSTYCCGYEDSVSSALGFCFFISSSGRRATLTVGMSKAIHSCAKCALPNEQGCSWISVGTRVQHICFQELLRALPLGLNLIPPYRCAGLMRAFIGTVPIPPYRCLQLINLPRLQTYQFLDRIIWVSLCCTCVVVIDYYRVLSSFALGQCYALHCIINWTGCLEVRIRGWNVE